MAQPRTKKNGAAPKPSARERIFGTASELFYKHGIRAVGVETIAAGAATTKMGLYRNFPSKDELVAEWLRGHDEKFWKDWDAMSRRFPHNPRRQLNAAFNMLSKHFADPSARGCAMANAAVEITEKTHPARQVIETHKRKLRARFLELCTGAGARQPGILADQLFLLMEGALVTVVTLGVRGPARNVVPAAKALIRSQLD